MNKKKKISEIFASTLCILIYMLSGALMGFFASLFVLSADLENEGKYRSIELQHQVIMEQNEDFKYCPYCGEELER